MSTVEYVVVGIAIFVLFSIYGCIYIMTSEKKKKEKPGILFSLYEFISKKIEFWRKEKCVRCGNATAYTKKTPTIQRVGYKEGAGQLCMNCDNWLYPRSTAGR